MNPNFIKKSTGFLTLSPLVEAPGRGMLSVPPILIPFSRAAGTQKLVATRDVIAAPPATATNLTMRTLSISLVSCYPASGLAPELTKDMNVR